MSNQIGSNELKSGSRSLRKTKNASTCCSNTIIISGKSSEEINEDDVFVELTTLSLEATEYEEQDAKGVVR